MKNYKLYKVGGCIRDALLGVRSKDIDFTFEFSQEFVDSIHRKSDVTAEWFYHSMNNILKQDGFDIKLEVPEAFTTRALFPKDHKYAGLGADFVLARKETYPDPETRMPKVEIGTLFDDLQRRDFTVNAIAEDEDGILIDPFGGQADLKQGILRCPISAQTSFNDDPLRMLRALRFSITKNFTMDSSIERVILKDQEMWMKFLNVVSEERIRDEVYKMFKHDTIKTLRLLSDLEKLTDISVLKYIFGENMWLEPTTKKRK
jgi:tRNA nucleotidyltransferase/poly(A) polymerase